MFSSVTGFDWTRKEMTVLPLLTGLRYFDVPIRRDDVICVVSPMADNAEVPVMYPMVLPPLTRKSFAISFCDGPSTL